MSNTAINRQIVQEGLDRRAAEAKRREAKLEAQARKLRLIINDNHIAKTSHKQPEPACTVQEIPDEETYTFTNEMPAERAESAQEAAYCFMWYQMMVRLFVPALIAAFSLSLTAYWSFPLWLTLPVAIAGFTISILTLTVWCFYMGNNDSE